MIIVVEERSWNAIERALFIVSWAIEAPKLSNFDEHTFGIDFETMRQCRKIISSLRPRVGCGIFMIKIVK
jgi:ABC-type Mn2+/Zn2+ transport system ATPase subunit